MHDNRWEAEKEDEMEKETEGEVKEKNDPLSSRDKVQQGLGLCNVWDIDHAGILGVK